MSRIGRLAIAVPAGASVPVSGQTIKAKGPKGELELVLPEVITPKLENNELTVLPRADLMKAANETIEAAKAKGKRAPTLAESLDANARTQWGTARARAANLVDGVTKGYSKTLELVGVGYRAQKIGTDLKLALGYSHDVIYKAPKGITIASSKPTEIVITGADKQAVRSEEHTSELH